MCSPEERVCLGGGGEGGCGDVWRENPLPLKCFAHVRQAQDSPPPLIKVHGTSPWENPGRPSGAYVSQRGEREQSDCDCGRTIKGRNLFQSESGGKAWGHHTGGFPEGGGPLYSVSHRQARWELWRVSIVSAWRAPRGTRLPAHPPPPRSVPRGSQRQCLRCQRLGFAARVFPSRSPPCPAALASFHKLTSTFFSHPKCTTGTPGPRPRHSLTPWPLSAKLREEAA